MKTRLSWPCSAQARRRLTGPRAGWHGWFSQSCWLRGFASTRRPGASPDGRSSCPPTHPPSMKFRGSRTGWLAITIPPPALGAVPFNWMVTPAFWSAPGLSWSYPRSSRSMGVWPSNRIRGSEARSLTYAGRRRMASSSASTTRAGWSWLWVSRNPGSNSKAQSCRSKNG